MPYPPSVQYEAATEPALESDEELAGAGAGAAAPPAPRKSVAPTKKWRAASEASDASSESSSEMDGDLDDFDVYVPMGDELRLVDLVALFHFKPSADIDRVALKGLTVSLRELMARTLSQKANAELLLGPLRGALDKAISTLPADASVHHAGDDNAALITALGTDIMRLKDITMELVELVYHVSVHPSASKLYPLKFKFLIDVVHVNAKKYESGYWEMSTDLDSPSLDVPQHKVLEASGADGRSHWALLSNETNCDGGSETACDCLKGKWATLGDYLSTVSWAFPTFEAARDASDDIQDALLGLPKPYLYKGPIWGSPAGAGGSGGAGAAAAAGSGGAGAGSGPAAEAIDAAYSSLASLLGYPPAPDAAPSSGEASPVWAPPAAGAGAGAAVAAPPAPLKKARPAAAPLFPAAGAEVPAIGAVRPAEIAGLASDAEASDAKSDGARDYRPQRTILYSFLDDTNLPHVFTSRSQAFAAASALDARTEWVTEVSTTQDIRTGDGIYAVVHRFNVIAVGTDAEEVRASYNALRDLGMEPLSMAYATVGSSAVGPAAGSGAGQKRRREA